ncbi:MAG: YccF domain-containing protein [Woeseiaceae bacterium]|nr:YccF domain-containing protein [Woeseiaceae bacterium]
MNSIGNIIFFVFGGFVIFAGYVLGGIILCITIIGIPFGIQCFKLAGGVLAPFGREVREKEPPGGALSIIMNVIWILLPGLELAIMHLILAAVFAITIVGIPIASQHIKLIPMALIPFGREMRDESTGRTYP